VSVPVEVVGVRIEMPSNQPILLLKEVDGVRYLPIWVGAVEASAIAFAQQGLEPVRPLTHDLFSSVLKILNSEVSRVEVTDLIDGVFFAELHLNGGGWYDAPIARYAVRVNGLTDFFLTKLDVLTGWEQIPVCVAYEIDGKRVEELPSSQSDFHHAKPIYEYLPGWSEDISKARRIEDLPENARAYVKFLEEISGAPMSAIGVGPGRDETIVVRDLI